MEKRADKNKIWFLVAKKINHSVHRLHIFSILNILIDEIINDIRSGKELKIKNFGTLKLKPLKSKKIIDITTGSKMMSRPRFALRFKLNKKLNKILVSKSFERLKGNVWKKDQE